MGVGREGRGQPDHSPQACDAKWGKSFVSRKGVGMGKTACVKAVLIYFLGFRCWAWIVSMEEDKDEEI